MTRGETEEQILARVIHDLCCLGEICRLDTEGVPFCALCECSHLNGAHTPGGACTEKPCPCRDFKWTGKSSPKLWRERIGEDL